MASRNNPLNVYKGDDALRDFFDPDKQPLLPLVELPAGLNPFRRDGVRIYAKLLTALPAQNVKALPALNMLQRNMDAGNKRIVEASSGSTVTSLGIISRVLHGNESTTSYATNKTELNRLRQLQFFGVGVELYGGPAQPEDADPRGAIEWCRQLGRQSDDILNPAQYDNDDNWQSHVRWTGPQIWEQLPEINVFCMGMGSTGCVTGVGRYLKAQKSSVQIVGVCNADRDSIPGPRPAGVVDDSTFPWKDVVDSTEIVKSEESYRMSMALSRHGIIAGPSSGMALHGLLTMLDRRKAAGNLAPAHCVFVCCDLPYQYLDGYFKRLAQDEFPPINNADLLSIDQDAYELTWELDTHGARPVPRELIDFVQKVRLDMIDSDSDGDSNGDGDGDMRVTVIDLRSQKDFDDCHVAGSSSSPLLALSAASISPFDFEDSSQLHTQWNALRHKFDNWHVPTPTVIVDYNGETGRLATAVLRAKGWTAFSIRDGMTGLQQLLALRDDSPDGRVDSIINSLELGDADILSGRC